MSANRHKNGCDHKYPFVIGCADVVVTVRLKSEPLLMTVDRHCDCIFCGPHVERVRILREYHGMQHYYKGQVLHADPKLPARFVTRGQA